MDTYKDSPLIYVLKCNNMYETLHEHRGLSISKTALTKISIYFYPQCMNVVNPQGLDDSFRDILPAKHYSTDDCTDYSLVESLAS